MGLEAALTCNDEASLILRQSIPGQKKAKFKVSKEARTEFWKRNHSPEYFCNAFPRFVCFMNCLCCVENVDGKIRKASLTCVSVVFRVLCASVFGLQDEDVVAEGINCIMFICSTSLCAGYIPRSDSLLPTFGISCMCCDRPHADHLFKHSGLATHGSSGSELQFMRLVCRVGSIGWDSHYYMSLVRSESRLSGQFNKYNIESKQQSFRQHLCLNIFGTHPSGIGPAPCELCRNKSLVEHELPEIVRLELEYLRKERASELLGLVSAVDCHFEEAARYAELLRHLEVDSSSLTDKAAKQCKGILTKLKEYPHQVTHSDVKFYTDQFKLSDEDATLLLSCATASTSAKAESSIARGGVRSTELDCKRNASAEQGKVASANGPLVPSPAPVSAPISAEERQLQALTAAQLAAAPDDDAADLARLVAVLARAKVLPPSIRPDFARKLLDQGVSDEQAIVTSLSAHPPDFDLVRDIGMTAVQQRSLNTYLKDLR